MRTFSESEQSRGASLGVQGLGLPARFIKHVTHMMSHNVTNPILSKRDDVNKGVKED